jgi:hypothetical protein
LLLIGPGAGAADEAEQDASEARARAIMKRTAEYLGTLERFSFEAEIEYDVLQSSGQTLEFGGIRKIQVRRPNRLRVLLEEREGGKRQFTFDGEKVVFYSPEKNLFAKVAIEGSLERALEHVVERLDQPAPLSEIVRSDLDQLVEETVESALYVGESRIDGVPCDHLAFSGSEVDWQIWVSRADPPLPHRLTITYRSFEGSPRFRARLRNWNVSADLSHSVFAFEPPPGAVQIPVVAESPPGQPKKGAQ